MKLLGGIGLGTFPFSRVFGEINTKEAERIVNTYIDSGGKYIQTAPYYVGVDSLMGRILKSIPREKYYISTLCVKNREGIRTGKYEAVIKQCEDSLRHFGLDYIDLYMTSTPKADDAPYRETVQAMADLQKQGKIREIGVANVNLNQLREYNSSGKVKFVQNRFSLLDQSISLELKNYCSQNNIGFIPYNVIEWGILTDRILSDITLRDNDLRKTLPIFRSEALTLIREWVSEYLKPIANELNTSIEGISILWALHQPGVSLCVLGATKVSQIRNNLLVRCLPCDMAIFENVNEAYRKLEHMVIQKGGTTVAEYFGNSYK